MIAPLLALALQATAPDAPSPEALTLGKQLAGSGMLATIAPMLIEKDIAELAAEAPDLSADERARLTEIGRVEGKAGVERLTASLGAAYAKRLSVADMRALVAHNAGPAAQRWREAEMPAVMEAMQTLGAIDLKKTVAAEFCARTGKLCDRD